jgi:hypothetical protein
MKAGLWEMKPVRQIMDGKDMTAMMAAAQAQMQQQLASLPPEQRAKLQGMLGHQGVIRICVSPAMAANGAPMADPEGHCPPASVNRSGNTTTFEFSCTENGRSRSGKGSSTVNGDTVTTHLDMKMTDAKGPHTMQADMQSTYLGADCQGVTPADQMAKPPGAGK